MPQTTTLRRRIVQIALAPLLVISMSACIPTLSENWIPAVNSPNPADPNAYEAGNCKSLLDVFENYGATPQELAFFGPVLRRESGCGLDRCNEATGDSGVAQLTALHQRPGYFFGTYHPGGWAGDLFGLRLGKANRCIDQDHPNMVPAAIWLYRGGGLPGSSRGRSAWNPQ